MIYFFAFVLGAVVFITGMSEVVATSSCETTTATTTTTTVSPPPIYFPTGPTSTPTSVAQAPPSGAAALPIPECFR